MIHKHSVRVYRMQEQQMARRHSAQEQQPLLAQEHR